MIDIHTHLLPDIDDGARSIEEGLELTKTLYDQGVSQAVCTPHYLPYDMSIREFASKRARAMELMTQACIPLIPASETYFHEFLLYADSLTPLCIEHTRYLLLELPEKEKWSKSFYNVLEQLIGYYDIIPVIAHIERYSQTSRHNIQKLRNHGCVIQMNTSAVLNTRMSRKALHYIRSGVIDVLGSDCHNLTDRKPRIQEAFQTIGQQLGEDYCNSYSLRAKQMVAGIDIRR